MPLVDGKVKPCKMCKQIRFTDTQKKDDILGVKSIDLALLDSPKAMWSFGKRQNVCVVK